MNTEKLRIFFTCCDFFWIGLEHERECRVNPMGTGYVGTESKSSSGVTCLPWNDVIFDYDPLPLDANSQDNKNYCRNIIGTAAWLQPSCFINEVDGMTVSTVQKPAPCSIRYCGIWLVNSLYNRQISIAWNCDKCAEEITNILIMHCLKYHNMISLL